MMRVLYIRKILFFLVICPVFSACMPLIAESRTIVLGGQKGWPALSVSKGITTGTGRFGYTCLQLDTNSPDVSRDTDLLLHFEQVDMPDSAGKYKTVKNSLIRTDKSAMGKYAALSLGTGSGMILRGIPGSMFGSGGRVGSFTIEFWLAPSIAENGETVFSWRSSRNEGGYPVYQMITVSFFGNHLEWKLSNVFDGYTASDGEVTLSGTRTVIPDVWSLHRLSFNEETGLLEYSIDEHTEALKYVTSTGHERGTIYEPVLGVPANIEICPQYTGRIDDFRITGTSETENGTDFSGDPVCGLYYDTYKKSGGRFETQPIATRPGSILNAVTAVTAIPPQTEIRLYARAGDNFFNWTDTEPAWIPVRNGFPVSAVSGLYFQIAADLFPDGAGKQTPSITQITLTYTEQPLPLPPFTVKAVAGDGSVILTWSYSVDDTAGGYYIYYGERPGEYLGRSAAEGPSPVDAGNTASCTLTGLKNGTIYYFAIAAWSRFDKRIAGQLSQEVFARPYGR